MKGTENFKRTIQEYLEERAKTDELFAKSYAKPNKSIDECITYILNEVQQSGCNGFEDNEIFGMAIHYYDEDNLDVGKKINCNIVVNHTVELTEEEKQELKDKARNDFYTEQLAKQRESLKPKKKAKVSVSEPSLFDSL
nr:MAG TPA: PcfK-like protein [Caudoviricetes sp.]